MEVNMINTSYLALVLNNYYYITYFLNLISLFLFSFSFSVFKYTNNNKKLF